MKKIVSEHKRWIESAHTQGARADLGGAHLSGADLSHTDLSHANLGGADLRGANLRANLEGADLTVARLDSADLSHITISNADLSGARLNAANLEGSSMDGVHLNQSSLQNARLSGTALSRANLSGARLESAKLDGAYLDGANLDGAVLAKANLNGADLTNAELRDASFYYADLEGVRFEPKPLTDVRGLIRAKHIELMTYGDNPDALMQLRKQFEQSGLRTQEREVTYALDRRRAELDGPVERWLKRAAFDWTCQYGMNPGRALWIWFMILVISSLIYVVSIHVPGESGIYRIAKKEDVATKEEVEERIRPRTARPRPLWLYPIRLVKTEARIFFWAIFFSLMSAFNIGFRDINFGRWLRLLPRTEYDLKAKGWARTVAGFQSLLSVYLIALWILTYFGRPFE